MSPALVLSALSLAGLACITGMACSAPPADRAFICEVDSDCPHAFICIVDEGAGRCRSLSSLDCEQNADCPSGLTCSDNSICAPAVIDCDAPMGDTEIFDLQAGGTHTCVLLRGGDVHCWGKNDEGQLGAGIDGSDQVRARDPLRVALETPVQAITMGAGHGCALSCGRIYCWGRNSEGQTGADIATAFSPTPVEVVLPYGLLARSIDAGHAHTCVIASDSRVYCWGRNTTYGAGPGANPQRAPHEIPELVGALQIALGTGHSCALLESGEVVCWGRSQDGQLGGGHQGPAERLPVEAGIEGDPDNIALWAGTNIACATDTEGAFCWGYGESGALGYGGDTSRSLPEPVIDLPEVPTTMALNSARNASDKRSTTCALSPTLYCWGDWHYGLLGVADLRENQLSPLAIPLPEGVNPLGLSLGATHGCVHDGSGVYCWGMEVAGFGDEELVTTPTLVAEFPRSEP